MDHITSPRLFLADDGVRKLLGRGNTSALFGMPGGIRTHIVRTNTVLETAAFRSATDISFGVP